MNEPLRIHLTYAVVSAVLSVAQGIHYLRRLDSQTALARRQTVRAVHDALSGVVAQDGKILLDGDALIGEKVPAVMVLGDDCLVTNCEIGL